MSNVSHDTKENLTSVVTIELKQADYETQVNNKLRKVGQTVAIKGFRKGKVPKGLVKKMYGNAIMVEEINHIVNHKISDYINENTLDILGQPIPLQQEELILDINKLGDLTFQYELGMTPKVEVPLLKKPPTFTNYAIDVTDKMVEEEVTNMLKRFGDVENPETGAKGKDAVTVTLEELDASGDIKEGGYSHQTSFGVDQLSVKARQTDLKKLKVGESLASIDIFKSFDKEKEEIGKTLLELEGEMLANVGSKFKLTLDKINRVADAKMDKAFFEKAYGKGSVKNEKEFKAKVKEEIGNYLAKASDSQLRADIFKKFADETTVELPDEFLMKWLKITKEEDVAEQDIESEYESFAANLKTSLVFQTISQDGELKVEAEELQEKIKETITEQFRYYGLPVTEDAEMMQNMMQRFMQDEKQVRQAHDQVMDTKIFQYLKEKVKVKDKTVTLDEFNALNQ